jgi:hypothetical protein
VRETRIPKGVGTIIDIAPIEDMQRPVWLMLAENGDLFRVDVSSGVWAKLGAARPTMPKTRLHISRRGEFAAVVNDYGLHGQVIDLRSGIVTLELDGGDYLPRLVPFSFAFAELQGRTIAVHRTVWNRLDMSDASDGQLLSQRQREERSEHYLDYFHGALYVSPSGTRILDDGWVWHPVGMPVSWSLDRWLSQNPWESEDGPTRRVVCARESYWDHAMTWVSEELVAIEGVDGVQIFDVTAAGPAGEGWRDDLPWARERIAFPGPAGRFFSSGQSLYSADATGLSVWDPHTGARTAHVDAFQPTHRHPGSGQLVQLVDGTLIEGDLCELAREGQN